MRDTIKGGGDDLLDVFTSTIVLTCHRWEYRNRLRVKHPGSWPFPNLEKSATTGADREQESECHSKTYLGKTDGHPLSIPFRTSRRVHRRRSRLPYRNRTRRRGRSGRSRFESRVPQSV